METAGATAGATDAVGGVGAAAVVSCLVTDGATGAVGFLASLAACWAASLGSRLANRGSLDMGGLFTAGAAMLDLVVTVLGDAAAGGVGWMVILATGAAGGRSISNIFVLGWTRVCWS